METIDLTGFSANNPISQRCAEDITAEIDHYAAQRIVTTLLTHGAKVQQLDVFSYEATLPNGQMHTRLCSNHRISFPVGTLRYDGLVLAHSLAFRILFPDGLVVRGVSLASFGGEVAKTVLSLPKEAEPEQA
ncbi:MAG: hypothetical protein ABI413_05450 [Ktedonobacteraceae bacterium]